MELIQHHVKYKEIHGIDEIKLMTRSEHKLLHNKLRKEGKCKIPPETLSKISNCAHHRTSKYLKYKENYRKSHHYKNLCKIKNERYEENLYKFNFCLVLEDKISLEERIVYNMKTGNVFCCCVFYSNGKKIKYINGND